MIPYFTLSIDILYHDGVGRREWNVFCIYNFQHIYSYIFTLFGLPLSAKLMQTGFIFFKIRLALIDFK